MKYLLLAGAFLGVLGYAWFGRGDANVYAMAPTEVYQALRSAPVEPGGTGVFGRLDTSVSGNGDSVIYWNASGSHAAVHCEANIAPEGAGQSRLTAYCGGGGAGDGAAAGMVSAMHRKALIEHIDATLDKRSYDAHLAQGSTASGWPSDARQTDGSYGSAVGGALKMESDIKQDIKQMEQDQAATDAVRAAHSGVQFEPGKPMVNTNPNRR